MATAGTVRVWDRRGKRLGTVYLAYLPESGPTTMTKELTRLRRAVRQRWQGPLPRRCYVIGAGDRATTSYDKVLSRMKHPPTGVHRDGIRVVDSYPASERRWTLADVLFGKGQRSVGWVRTRPTWLLKPGGVNRVRHAAAALRDHVGLKGTKRAAFTKA